VRVNDRPHLVVPYSLTKFGRSVFGSGEDFFAFLRDSFDVRYEEGAERPRMMSVGLHMRLTGHPGRAKALIRFIQYIRGHPQVVGSAPARKSPPQRRSIHIKAKTKIMNISDLPHRAETCAMARVPGLSP
jgi:hypothetical protein